MLNERLMLDAVKPQSCWKANEGRATVWGARWSRCEPSYRPLYSDWVSPVGRY